MKKTLLGACVAALLISSNASEIWIGVGKIGGDPITSTEYAIGYEREFETHTSWIAGIDISYKYGRIKEEERELDEHGREEVMSKKIDEHALDLEGLWGKALDHHNKLFMITGLRVGDAEGTGVYGVGVGVEYQHILHNEMVVSFDVVRHFMKTEDDYYYQTNTFMVKVGYEF